MDLELGLLNGPEGVSHSYEFDNSNIIQITNCSKCKRNSDGQTEKTNVDIILCHGCTTIYSRLI